MRLPKHFKILQRWAGSDYGRHALQFLHINPTNKTIIATNGHVVIKAEAPDPIGYIDEPQRDDHDDAPYMLHQEELNALGFFEWLSVTSHQILGFKKLRPHKPLYERDTPEQPEGLTFPHAGAEKYCAPPNAESIKARVSLDPKYIALLSQTALKMGWNSASGHVTLTIGTERDPVHFEFLGKEGQKISGAIMPTLPRV